MGGHETSPSHTVLLAKRAKETTFSTILGFQFCQEDGPLLMLGPSLLIMHKESSKFGGLDPTK